MRTIDDYLAARTAFVGHDALVAEMVSGLKAELAGRLGEWRRVRFRNTDPPPGDFPPGTTDRLVDAHDRPLESAKMFDARLAAWHRLLAAMHAAWERLSETERLRVDAPHEEAD